MQFYMITSGKRAVCMTLRKLLLLQVLTDTADLQNLMHVSFSGSCCCETPLYSCSNGMLDLIRWMHLLQSDHMSYRRRNLSQ